MDKKIKKIIIIVFCIILVLGLVFAAAAVFFLGQLGGAFQVKDNGGLAALPCAPLSQVELGSPYISTNYPTAEFTTSGGKIYIASRRFDHTGLFASSKGSTAVYIGLTTNYPTWDSQHSTVSNSIKRMSVPENKYIEFDVPAGRYWLWSSRGGDIVIYSCEENGVSDPKPVR